MTSFQNIMHPMSSNVDLELAGEVCFSLTEFVEEITAIEK